MNALLQRAIEHLQKQHPSWIISYTHQVAIDCAKFAEKEIEEAERKAFEAGWRYCESTCDEFSQIGGAPSQIKADYKNWKEATK